MTSSSLAVLCRSMQLHIVELGLVVEVGELRRIFCIWPTKPRFFRAINCGLILKCIYRKREKSAIFKTVAGIPTKHSVTVRSSDVSHIPRHRSASRRSANHGFLGEKSEKVPVWDGILQYCYILRKWKGWKQTYCHEIWWKPYCCLKKS